MRISCTTGPEEETGGLGQLLMLVFAPVAGVLVVAIMLICCLVIVIRLKRKSKKPRLDSAADTHVEVLVVIDRLLNYWCYVGILVNPRHACAARVTVVVLCVCVCVCVCMCVCVSVCLSVCESTRYSGGTRNLK